MHQNSVLLDARMAPARAELLTGPGDVKDDDDSGAVIY